MKNIGYAFILLLFLALAAPMPGMAAPDAGVAGEEKAPAAAPGKEEGKPVEKTATKAGGKPEGKDVGTGSAKGRGP